MTLPFIIRFDLRNPAISAATMADRYAAALDMAAWADEHGCFAIVLSEHHGSPDGYLPSPLIMVAAMAARTTNVRFSVAALIAPFHDPLRLAEDLVVLDNISRGRVDVTLAGGYVREEFEMFGVATNERARLVTEAVSTLKAAFTGQPFEFRGRTVTVTPAPERTGGPGITLGGSSERAARRAAQIADGFLPSVPDVWPFYRDEVISLGRPDPGPCPTGDNRIVALAEDPDKGWHDMGPYFLHEMNSYGAWQAANHVASPYSPVDNIDQLRTTNAYAVLTPEEYVGEIQAAPFPFVMLHPMCGGIPPELAWTSLRLFEREVMPAFA